MRGHIHNCSRAFASNQRSSNNLQQRQRALASQLTCDTTSTDRTLTLMTRSKLSSLASKKLSSEVTPVSTNEIYQQKSFTSVIDQQIYWACFQHGVERFSNRRVVCNIHCHRFTLNFLADAVGKKLSSRITFFSESKSSTVRETATTVAPFFDRSTQISRPMPFPAPVCTN